MLNTNDIVKLSDGIEYLVVSKVNYQGGIYLYLINVADNTNVKFIELYDKEVIEVSDNSLLDELIKLIVLKKRLNF